MGIDIDQEVRKFETMLDSGAFKLDMLSNTDEDYSSGKEERDSLAFKAFIATDEAKSILEM